MSTVSLDVRVWGSEYFLFDSHYDDSELKVNYARSLIRVKDNLKNHDFDFGRLLENVPRRPGHPKAPWRYNASYEMLGMLTKYNLEYRRPYPVAENAPFEKWRYAFWDDLEKEGVAARLQLPEFTASESALSSSAIWTRVDVDWRWHNTMMVSLKSAVGDLRPSGDVAVRQVLGISFPAFCWLLRNSHNASDIEKAWVYLPIVRRGKAARGAKGRGNRKRDKN